MPRINIEEKWWVDPRRFKLAVLLGDHYAADGLFFGAVKLCQLSKSHRISKTDWDLEPKLALLEKVGLAVVEGDSVYIKGTNEHFEWLRLRKEQGSRGGRSKRKQTEANGSKPKQMEPSSSSSSSFSSSNSISTSKTKNAMTSSRVTATAGFIESYKSSYKTKYGTEPVLNAKVYSQIKNLIGRIGEGDAISLLSFYFSHPNAFYARAMHTLGPLLKDCEALVAEMRSGKKWEPPKSYYQANNGIKLFDFDEALKECENETE